MKLALLSTKDGLEKSITDLKNHYYSLVSLKSRSKKLFQFFCGKSNQAAQESKEVLDQFSEQIIKLSDDELTNLYNEIIQDRDRFTKKMIIPSFLSTVILAGSLVGPRYIPGLSDRGRSALSASGFLLCCFVAIGACYTFLPERTAAKELMNAIVAERERRENTLNQGIQLEEECGIHRSSIS